eukprot:gene8011-8659_t
MKVIVCLFVCLTIFITDSNYGVDGYRSGAPTLLKGYSSFPQGEIQLIHFIQNRNILHSSAPNQNRIPLKPYKQYDPYLRQDRTSSSNDASAATTTTLNTNTASNLSQSTPAMLDAASKGNSELALKIFNEIIQSKLQNHRIFLNLITCNKLIKEMGNHGHLSACEAIINRLNTISTSFPYLTPNLITYSTFISRAGNWKKVSLAQQYFDVLIEKGHIPDDYTFNALINAYVKVNDMKSALHTLTKMIEEYNIPPTITTMNTLLDGFGRIGQIDSGVKLLQKFLPDGASSMDQHTYSALIHGYCIVNQLDKAEEYLTTMIDRGFKNCIEGYSLLINAYGQARQIHHAYRVYELMKQKGQRPNRIIITSLINGCGKAGEVALAFQLYQSMLQSNDPQCQPNSVTCNSLIDISLKQGDVSKAIEIIRDMKRRNIPLTAITYTTIISHVARLQERNDIEMLVSLIVSPSEKDKRIKILQTSNTTTSSPFLLRYDYDPMMSSRESLSLHRLHIVYEEMKKEKIRIDHGFYNTLINSYAEIGLLDKALDIVTVMRSAEGIEPDLITYTSLIKACYLSRQGVVSRNKGDEIFDEMRQRTNHFSTYIAANEVTYSTLFQLHFSDSLAVDQIDLTRVYQLCLWMRQSKFSIPLRVLTNAARVAERQNNLTAVIQFIELQRELYQLPPLQDLLSQFSSQEDYIHRLQSGGVGGGKMMVMMSEVSSSSLRIHENSWKILNTMLYYTIGNYDYHEKELLESSSIGYPRKILQKMKWIIEKELKQYYIRQTTRN